MLCTMEINIIICLLKNWRGKKVFKTTAKNIISAVSVNLPKDSYRIVDASP